MDNILDVGPFPIGGDGTTVSNTEYSFTDPFSNNLGPSMRYIFDFENPGEYFAILPAGQSGHFFSDHYKDMTEYWLDGKYIKIYTSIDSIENNNYKLLIIEPHNK